MNSVKTTKDTAKQLIKRAQEITGSDEPSEELRDVSILSRRPHITHSKDCQALPLYVG